MSYDKKDGYYRKAKAEGYRSRATYKLKQIDGKFRIIRPGDIVIDLGAAPGGPDRGTSSRRTSGPWNPSRGCCS